MSPSKARLRLKHPGLCIGCDGAGVVVGNGGRMLCVVCEGTGVLR